MNLNDLLYSLFKEKLSPSLSAYLKRQGLVSVKDILEFYPSRYQDRRILQGFPSLFNDKQSYTLTQQIKIYRHETFTAKGQRNLKLYFTNQEGQEGSLLCFNRSFLAKAFPVGTQALVYGTFNYSYAQWSSANFDIEKALRLNSSTRFGKILSLYRGQLQYNPSFNKFLAKILDRYLAIIEEDIPITFQKRQSMGSLRDSLKEIHLPSSLESLALARETLEKREVFYFHSSLIYQAKFFASKRKRKVVDLSLLQKAQESLPFSLSLDQQKALREICQDLGGTRPMNRLLQGDVGSGKTLVALLSALYVMYAKQQVAIMAPTELLARQHLETFKKYWSLLGFKVALLSASLQGKEKRETYQAIQEGKVHIIFGTHSLFSQSLEFHCLGYVIVDEQQKFGLAQREKLKEKGIQADVLVMSATPIPRTMALMLMELTPVSTLYSQAIAKEPIQTFLVERSNRKRAYEFSLKELNKGHQVYVVHPIIEGSASCYLPSIQEFYKELQSSFSSYSVALLHSRLKDEQKIQIMQDFSLHKIDLLLSTSMVEVGMDVPNATVMMISGAEYFGLASLHQLRGRVGRGEQPSYCFLIYSLPLEENAKKRLKLIRESEDGFYLAQEDLKMRGSGDFISDKQSGKLCLKLFDLEKNEELFLAIKNEAMLYFSSEGSIPEEEKQALYQAIKERLAK